MATFHPKMFKTILPLVLAHLWGCSLRTPPHELAAKFVSVAGVADVTEAVYRKNPTETVVFFGREGSSAAVGLKTMEEFDRFVTQLRLQEQTYREEIKQRGFQRLAARYLATASEGCSGRSLTSGEVIVEQTDFILKLSHGYRTFTGIVVESTVSLFFPVSFGKSEPPLLGEIRGGVIEFRDSPSQCIVILKPN